jgi:hypothetical protein
MEEIVDFINALDVELNVQMDKNAKQVVTKLESNYDDEALLNLSAYIDADKEKTYVYLKDLFDKYIEVEIDEESYETINEIFENMYTEENKQNAEKALKIIEKEIKATIKKEYCSIEKQELIINGKKVNTTKNTIELTYEQLSNELITVFTNLKENQEFLNCYEEPEELKEAFENLIENIENEKDSYQETNIKISTYTKGFLQEVVKTDIEIENDGESVTVEVKKLDNENYEFKISTSEEDETITGIINVKVEDKNSTITKITVNVPEFGKVTLNLNIKNEYNEEIETVKSKNTITQDEMTESDYEEILSNLQKTKLYEVIEGVIGQAAGIDDLLVNEEETTDVDNDDETDTDFITTGNQNSNTTVEENQIVTYDGKQKITFKIPDGYETTYKSNNYFSLRKSNDIDVTIKTQVATEDEYFENLDSTKQYYEESSYYKNVEISDLKTIDVNGRTFSYKMLKYDSEIGSNTTTYRNMYICSKISDKNIIIVETKDTGALTNTELKQLINIEVE